MLLMTIVFMLPSVFGSTQLAEFATDPAVTSSLSDAVAAASDQPRTRLSIVDLSQRAYDLRGKSATVARMYLDNLKHPDTLWFDILFAAGVIEELGYYDLAIEAYKLSKNKTKTRIYSGKADTEIVRLSQLAAEAFSAELSCALAAVQQIEYTNIPATELSYRSLEKSIAELEALICNKNIIDSQVERRLNVQLFRLETLLFSTRSVAPELVQELRAANAQRRQSFASYVAAREVFNYNLFKLRILHHSYEERKATIETAMGTILTNPLDSLRTGLVSAITQGGNFNVKKYDDKGVFQTFETLPSFDRFLEKPETKSLILQGNRREVVSGLLKSIQGSSSERIMSCAEVEEDETQLKVGHVKDIAKRYIRDTIIELAPGVTIHAAQTRLGSEINDTDNRDAWTITFPDGSTKTVLKTDCERVMYTGTGVEHSYEPSSVGRTLSINRTRSILLSEPLRVSVFVSMYDEDGSLTVYGLAVQKLLDDYFKQDKDFSRHFWHDTQPQAVIPPADVPRGVSSKKLNFNDRPPGK
jgi:hypothetical protein